MLAALPNLRAVAGLRSADGRRVRDGVLWRSDDPALLEPADVERVRRLGVVRVLDLRDEALVRRRGRNALQEAGVAHTWLPVQGWAPDAGGEDGLPPADLDMVEQYAGYLEHGGASLAEAVRAFAAEQGGVLVHCAAGKDRTGVLVALLLRLADVDVEDVVADYAETAERHPAMVANWRTRLPDIDALLAAQPPGLVGAPPETMRAFLALLEERYDDGARGWAASQGITPQELAAARRRLLGDGAAHDVTGAAR